MTLGSSWVVQPFFGAAHRSCIQMHHTGAGVMILGSIVRLRHQRLLQRRVLGTAHRSCIQLHRTVAVVNTLGSSAEVARIMHGGRRIARILRARLMRVPLNFMPLVAHN